MKSDVDRAFIERMQKAADLAGNATKLAEATGISRRSIGDYLAGGSEPSRSRLIAIARAAGVSVDWLATGEGQVSPGPVAAPTLDEKLVAVPRYDAVLAAGGGSLNERSRIVEHIPFPRNFIVHKLGKSSADGLAILEARGDSMEPTLGDGDLVMVDQTQTEPRDGLVAFILEDTAYIKRLRFGLGGVEVISDNRDLYPPERLTNEQAEQMTIIGRVRWIGKAM